jgi:hypothetical protein
MRSLLKRLRRGFLMLLSMSRSFWRTTVAEAAVTVDNDLVLKIPRTIDFHQMFLGEPIVPAA